MVLHTYLAALPVDPFGACVLPAYTWHRHVPLPPASASPGCSCCLCQTLNRFAAHFVSPCPCGCVRVAVFEWLCSCGCVPVAVFMWLCSCGCVHVAVFLCLLQVVVAVGVQHGTPQAAPPTSLAAADRGSHDTTPWQQQQHKQQ
jgi:hypothetical protein